VELPPAVDDVIAPLRDVITLLNVQIDGADRYVSDLAKADHVMRRLMTLPGIGPLTAAAYVAALDDVARFSGPAQVTSYLGLGAIVPSAHPRVQALLDNME
jgi:transposase